MISTFITAGTPCFTCAVAINSVEDKPVVVDFGEGENVYHEECLGPEVMAALQENQRRMMAGLN